jgi:hypothetical protein
MKNTNKLMTLCLSLVAIQTIQAISLSDTWNKAKNKAYSAKENISNKWENLDESTKNAIIGTGIATAGVAATAGAAYGGYKAFGDSEGSSVYGTGPSQEEILSKQGLSGSGKTVGEEVYELSKEKNLRPNYERPALGEIYARED